VNANKPMTGPLADESIVVHRALRTEIGNRNMRKEKAGPRGMPSQENNRSFQMLNDLSAMTMTSNEMPYAVGIAVDRPDEFIFILKGISLSFTLTRIFHTAYLH